MREKESLGATDTADESELGTVSESATGAEVGSSPSWVEVSPELYELGPELSRGGLGRVIAAQDRRLRRPVAIKQLYVRSARIDARFRREAQITARLQHPSIVPIYEAGRWPNGEPFYAMKLVSGRTLRELIAETTTLPQRLSLLSVVIKATEAVAYAHSLKIIHRDIKPVNIMVGGFGETLVIDWGLAKSLDDVESFADADLLAQVGTDDAPKPTPGRAAVLTRAGAVLGTPAFMSPEQARGEAADLRADVYSLGAVLYSVLSGAEPSGRVPKQRGRTTSPLAPPPLAELVPDAPPELIAIVEKAMGAEPATRYGDASALLADLRLFETGQRVRAHQYTSLALLWRWLRRHRVGLALALVAGVGAVGIAATALLSARRIIRERDAAQAARALAEQTREVAERRRGELLLSQARLLVEKHPTEAVATMKEYVASGQPDWRAVSSLVAEARSRFVSRHVLLSATEPALSPDGRWVASIDGDVVSALDLDAETIRTSALPGAKSPLAFGGSRSFLAQTRALDVVLVNLEDRSAKVLGRLEREAIAAATTAEGSRVIVAVAGDEGALWAFDGGPPARRLEAHGSAVRRLALSPDGSWAASVGADGSARLLRLARGTAVAVGQGAHVWSASFSPDSRLLALAMVDNTVRTIELESGRERRLVGHEGAVGCLAFSPDGKTLYSGSVDSTVRAWNLASGASRVLKGHEGIIERIAASPTGRFLATASPDQTIRVWDLALGESAELRGHDDYVRALAFSADERRLVTADASNQVRSWELPPPPRLVPAGGPIDELASAPTGELLAVRRGELRLFSWETGALRSSRKIASVQAPLSVAERGAVHAAAGEDGDVLLWTDVASAPTILRGHHQQVRALALSPDGRWLASGGDDHVVRVWNVAQGRPARVLEGHRAVVWVLAFSPDGRSLASAGDDKEVRLWDLETGAARTLPAADIVYSVSFSPDGTRLAYSGGDATVRVHTLASGETATLPGHSASVRPVLFSPDGRHLASGSDDRTARLWTLPAMTSVVLPHDEPVRLLQFSGDGRRLLTAEGHSTRLWDVERAEELLRVRGSKPANYASLSLDGEWLAVASSGDAFVRVWSTHVGPALSGPATLDRLSTAHLGDDGRVSSPWPAGAPARADASPGSGP